MEKGNGIANPLGREGSFVKPVKREEALFIHQGKEGALHNPCGIQWKKGRSLQMLFKGRETLVDPEGGNEGPKPVPEGCGFVESLFLPYAFC
jgi:hypothetical protein